MKRVYYNKLIRDNITAKIEENGEAYSVREITDPEEFEQELLKKVTEEASALARVRSQEAFLDEYADLVVVLEELLTHYGFAASTIEQALAENTARKGGFKKRHYLYWSEKNGYVSNESPQGTR